MVWSPSLTSWRRALDSGVWSPLARFRRRLVAFLAAHCKMLMGVCVEALRCIFEALPLVYKSFVSDKAAFADVVVQGGVCGKETSRPIVMELLLRACLH